MGNEMTETNGHRDFESKDLEPLKRYLKSMKVFRNAAIKRFKSALTKE